MAIQYKMDVLTKLKEKGYNTTKLRREKLLSESVIQQLRQKELVSWKNIDKLCELLGCEVGELLERS